MMYSHWAEPGQGPGRFHITPELGQRLKPTVPHCSRSPSRFRSVCTRHKTSINIKPIDYLHAYAKIGFNHLPDYSSEGILEKCVPNTNYCNFTKSVVHVRHLLESLIFFYLYQDQLCPVHTCEKCV